MNYWPRWISAIKKRTATLSLAEMGAYDRLLDHYYAEEQPLPADLDECCRIAVALTKDERKAVERVLAKFFTLTPTGYCNERADEEIALALPKIAAAQANGKRGGRPKGSTKKPNGLPAGLPVDTQPKPAAKAPHPHSSEANASDAADAPAAGVTKAEIWRAAVEVLQAGGCKAEATARTFMGKLVQDHTFPVVAQAVTAAVAAQPADAREYLTATCQRLKGERRDPITVPSTDTRADEFNAAMREREATMTRPPAAILALAGKAVRTA